MPAWDASWISLAYNPREDLGVFAFRRVFAAPSLSDVRANGEGGGGGVSGLPIRVSADNRYKLYCNGRLVGMGPQRGDERHWFYETYDLAPFLVEGDNELVALVWNFGWMAPMAQHTVRTAFVCEDLARDIQNLSTPGEWQVARVPGWDFAMMHSGAGEFYIDVGPGEITDARLLPLSSRERGLGGEGTPDLFLDSARLDWRRPHVISHAEDRGSNGGGTPWMLIPATLPPQRYDLRCTLPLAPMNGGERGLGGEGRLPDEWVLVPGVPLLLDFGELVCAYPRLYASGPAGTELRVTYAESLWIPGTNEKGNRNETVGKEIRGYQDRFILSGGQDVFEPLWWRTFRFVEIEVLRGSDVSSEEANIDEMSVPVREILGETPEPRVRFEVFETGYPYQVESSFEADDPWVKPIWDVSVRTAQRCAGETYFDCPYYEQLQYVGDSRIQALIGYYLGRDRRLQRNCIDQIGWSIMENGLTQSRYPSRQTQVIPPFSLWWLMMMHDQYMHDDADRYEAERFLGVENAVKTAWIRMRRMNKHMPAEWSSTFWNFVDWVPSWPWGVPPGAADSTVNRLTNELDDMAISIWLEQEHRSRGSTLPSPVRRLEELRSKLIWKEGLVTDPLDESWAPSEHAEALYRCIQMMAGQDPDPWPTDALERANAAKCTYYFSYYKHLAMHAGMQDAGLRAESGIPASPIPAYLASLAPWKEQIENGLTTFAENPEPTRSDCHAWSAHPILGFFQIVAGVTSIAPAWKKAQICPHPGNLRRFDARIAHPDGELRVKFEDSRLEIDTPVPAILNWQGKMQDLKAGRHRI